jgi:hypothetical protein
MGNIKLLALSTLFFGQLAFACGSTITGGAGSTEQTNTFSECSNPGNPNYNTVGSAAPPSTPYGAGGGYFPPEYYQAMTKQAKDKADYCRKNNYPANVPFCPGQKEAKNKCLQASNASSLLCELDAAQVLSDKVYSCSFVIFNDNALAQCNLAATTDNAARLKVCSVNKTLGDDYCNNNF